MARRGVRRPDSKDAELSPDGKYLYVPGAAGRQIAIFRIGSDRMPIELPAGESPVQAPEGVTTGFVPEERMPPPCSHREGAGREYSSVCTLTRFRSRCVPQGDLQKRWLGPWAELDSTKFAVRTDILTR